MDCFQPTDYKDWRISLKYPQSLMRNTAKSGCQANYTLTPDIDMVPNAGLDLQLDSFLERVENCDENYDAYETEDCDMCDKCAFVVPVYEIAANVTRFPANKTELIDYIRANKAREFHKVIALAGEPIL